MLSLNGAQDFWQRLEFCITWLEDFMLHVARVMCILNFARNIKKYTWPLVHSSCQTTGEAGPCVSVSICPGEPCVSWFDR